MLEKLVSSLHKEMGRTLPGVKAQLKMSPHVKRTGDLHVRKTGNPRPSGVLILLYESGGNIRFPLIQRPKYNGAHSGQVSFPGGKKELGDKDFIDTALREAHEEIGVERSKIHVMGYLSELYIWASNFTVQPVLSYMREVPVFKPDCTEVESVIEASLDNILDSNFRKQTEIKNSLGLKISAPYFDIEHKVVWGATAMMLSELAALIQRSDFLNNK